MSTGNSNKIEITIGIPVYNGEKFISEKISSIFNLNYDNFELVISDNGSTDLTKKICEEFASRDDRIRFFSQEENLGPNWNFDFILKKAKGVYFMWTAVDDKILPGFIEKNISILEKNDGVVCSISQVKPYGEKTEFLLQKQTTGFFRKLKKKIIGSFTPLKNIPTFGPYRKKIRTYLKTRGHHQVFYGIYRTKQIQKIFVSEFITGFDFATMLNVLKYGDFFVLDEVLNYRYDGGASSSGYFNYVKSFKINFPESLFLYYPFTKWCWKNLEKRVFFRNIDCIIKWNLEIIFYIVVDISRKIGLGILVNPPNLNKNKKNSGNVKY
jgi:glycosyltransferase involved in cell wall biosynthesis